MSKSTNTSVYVAVSGGVDSSVSAALLDEAGYDVTGVFMRVWEPPFLDCNWKRERHDAMRVCAKLDIDFEEFDLSEEYKESVVDYMIREYKAGRTPNPDVMCNKRIKFGAFYNKAMEDGADMVATGHYAQIIRHDDNTSKENCMLKRGVDSQKDQTYFLWTLSQDYLHHTLFPVGQYEKSQVRNMAKDRDLFTHKKDDSQGLCFLGHVDMQEFLKAFVDTEPGNIYNTDGDIVGTHDGAIFYTIGQRHGFDVTDKNPESGPWYVVDKNIQENTITVSDNTNSDGPLYNAGRLEIEHTNWIHDAPDENNTYHAQVRYNQTPQPCTIIHKENGAEVILQKNQRAVAEGQSCVIYNEDICLGGGVIESTKNSTQ